MLTGANIDKTFNSGQSVQDVRLDYHNVQFLYSDGEFYNFMDNETFEQVMIEEKMIEKPDLLKEGSQIEVLFHASAGTPLTVDMPQYIVLEVSYTEPGVRGDTATNAMKPAKVETGAEIKVPLFINEGDKIKIDTKTGTYVERVNK